MNKQEEILLNKHLDIVLKMNKKVNITSISSFEEGKLLHIVDSLQGVPFIENDCKKNLIDIGSGAGYPGIPIAICSNVNVALCETVNKKAVVLNNIIDELKLDNVKVISDRIENVSISHYEKFDYVTARALAKIKSLLELSSPLLKINGRLLCYKSEKYNEEIVESNPILEKLGFKLEKICDTSYENINRKIIIYKKISHAQIKLPRKLGFAQKKPLI